MRCLHCDGKLPLYRKITNGQFCSATHRRAYWQDQERLAVERLSQTHDSLRAYRPPDAEAILGGAPLSNPFYLDGHGRREDAVLDFARTASNRDEVVLAGFLRSGHLLASDWSSVPALSAPAPLDFAASAPEFSATSGATPVSPSALLFDVPVAGAFDLAAAASPAAMERSRPAVKPLTPATAPVLHANELAIAPEKPAVLLTAPAEIVEVPVVAGAHAVVEEPAVVEAIVETTAPAVEEPAVFESVEPEVPAPPVAAAVPLEKFGVAAFAFSPARIETAPLAVGIPAPHADRA